VTLTPTDSFGLLGTSKTQPVAIANAPPVVTAPPAPADRTVDEGALAVFAPGSFGSFSDAGLADKPWAVDIDWGDGSAHTTFSMGSQGALPSTNTGHTYADGPKSYPVSVTVKDKDGGSSVTPRTLEILSASLMSRAWRERWGAGAICMRLCELALHISSIYPVDIEGQE
jgi:hypothetical protein